MADPYIRKIAPGQFEYGYVTRSRNFRKSPDRYVPVGVRATVAEANEHMLALPLATDGDSNG